MKYCKHCGVLYSSLLDHCPKCDPSIVSHVEPPAPEADKRTRTRQWVWLCVGIPLLILFLYGIGLLMTRLS